MQIEEHETQISYDYAERLIRVYTTREGVVNGIQRRLGTAALKQCTITPMQQAWQLTIPMSLARSPEMLVKLCNPELKSTFPGLAG